MIECGDEAGHAIQLSQVFYNLLHNAIKFCDKQPVITVNCKTEDGFYILSVSDNGIGFALGNKDTIFEVLNVSQINKLMRARVLGLPFVRK